MHINEEELQNMIKILVVIGTRPEAIKMAPLIIELRDHSARIETVVVTTAQHREMLDQVLDVFGIVPDYDLNIMTANQSLSLVTSKVLAGIEQTIEKESPSMMLVQGDTTTTFAASLAAFYHKVSIGHVEAGLRTNDKYYPFPEEINRSLVSVLADLHFAPTEWARGNLLKQGVSPERIVVTGNTVIDALFQIIDKKRQVDLNLNLNDHRTILVTAHRRENFGQPLLNICNALKTLIHRNSDIQIVYPVHPNPNVADVARRELGRTDRIHLIEPASYAPFVHLMNSSYLILTDSGGIQEEAPSLGKPVLVLRNETERPEALDAGTVRLVGTDVENILENVENLLLNPNEYRKMSQASNPYGDGRASKRIVRTILNYQSN
jgi:UDP-N-acetylglucosamine 2-epimerase (non-hydrolysing)